MKKYIILLLLVTMLFPKKYKDFVMPENITVSEYRDEIVGVFEVEGMKENEIYSRTLEWLADRIVDSKSAIELKDEENFKIVGRTGFDFIDIMAMKTPRTILHTFKIEIKEGRYRITFSNLKVPYPDGTAMYFNDTMKIRQKYFKKWWNHSVGEKILNTFLSLQEFILNKETDEEW